MHPWLSGFGDEVAPSDLEHPFAVRVVRFLERAEDGVATIRGARRQEGRELLVADVRTGRPQAPAFPIARVEPVAILFVPDEAPRVLALRRGFPDTPHQNWMPKEFPCGLCIDDRPWSEARATYTPAELVDRIILWFRKAGLGQLHDAAQPLDPLFVGQGFHIILPRTAFEPTHDRPAELFAFRTSPNRPQYVSVRPLSELPPNLRDVDGGLAVVTFDLAAQAMTRLRWLPRDLANLDAEMAERGLRVLETLRERIVAWKTDPAQQKRWLSSNLCLLFRIPIIHPVTGLTGATSTIAFVTPKTAGEVGEALGVLYRNSWDERAAVPYVLAQPPAPSKPDEVALEGAYVHAEFDAVLAAALAGREEPDGRRTVVVGAGAIGAMVTEPLVREGSFSRLLLADDDTFLPHNIARHTLGTEAIGVEKAGALAARLSSLRPDLELSVADCQVGAGMPDEVGTALAEADLILDASASVPTARFLNDGAWPGRRVSVFFNPVGTSAVLLLEDRERTCDLRSLEAIYHREIQTNDALQDHLQTRAMIAYTGACRSLTSTIGATQLTALSGLLADGLRRALNEDGAIVRIWMLGQDGSVAVVSPSTAMSRIKAGDWSVTLPQGLHTALHAERQRCLPHETGGALLGIIDLEACRIDLVDALPAPVDSRGSETAFERGIIGLRSSVEAATARSMEQIRYVGEWHSHPVGSAVRPSRTDIIESARLTDVLGVEGFPAVMLIVGDDTINIVVSEPSVSAPGNR